MQHCVCAVILLQALTRRDLITKKHCTKEEFQQLVTEAFVGWLITDGYGAYRY
ncbi:MAG: hypothetical protein QNJ34_08055 [Xenococcaceae cyanobacterium MO_188.B29]|nr:hypothetical protein [Xenococcaceae cyanobacterium MO_188.B29]